LSRKKFKVLAPDGHLLLRQCPTNYRISRRYAQYRHPGRESVRFSSCLATRPSRAIWQTFAITRISFRVKTAR
jgi:ribosomal protein S14